MKVNRTTLLNEIVAMQPGLSNREIIEQSGCIVFKNGNLYSFNDEIACVCKTSLKGITGAIRASSLINLLSKMSEDGIDISVVKNELIIKGQSRKAGITFDKEIILPIDMIEVPQKWVKLPDEFQKALSMVRPSVGVDASKFVLTCINFMPDAIQACDGYEGGNYVIKLPMKNSFLIRGDSAKYINASFDSFGMTKNWICFKSKTVVLCCRKYKEKYPDLAPILKFSGTPAELPKSIEGAVELANIFSSQLEAGENENLVTITLSKDYIEVFGQGQDGWLKERRKAKYNGDTITFRTAPDLITSLVKKQTKCFISKDKIKIKSGNFTFVASLSVEKPKEE